MKLFKKTIIIEYIFSHRDLHSRKQRIEFRLYADNAHDSGVDLRCRFRAITVEKRSWPIGRPAQGAGLGELHSAIGQPVLHVQAVSVSTY